MGEQYIHSGQVVLGVAKDIERVKEFTSEKYKFKYKVGYVIVFGKASALLIKIKNGSIVQYNGEDYRRIKS